MIMHEDPVFRLRAENLKKAIMDFPSLREHFSEADLTVSDRVRKYRSVIFFSC